MSIGRRLAAAAALLGLTALLIQVAAQLEGATRLAAMGWGVVLGFLTLLLLSFFL